VPSGRRLDCRIWPYPEVFEINGEFRVRRVERKDLLTLSSFFDPNPK